MGRSLITRALLEVVVVVLGAALIAAASCVVQGVDPFLGMGLLVAVLGLGSYLSWRLARPKSHVACARATGAGIVMLVLGIAAGNAYFDRLLIRQMPALLAELRANPRVPNILDVTSSRMFRRVVVSGEPGKFTARFGLPDGTVLIYVSHADRWAHVKAQPCTRELKPGWFRQSRCAA